MNLSPSNRLTPWVGRLIIAKAVVLLLHMTVFTSPTLQAALRFVPGQALERPWTFVTYMFVHAGLLHLLGNMIMLFVFGPPVEHRMGGRAFLLYYLYCGIGAAVLSLALSGVLPSAAVPFAGASGAVLGVGVAFALLWPDAELLVFPLPTPIRRGRSSCSWWGSTLCSRSCCRATGSRTWRTWAAPPSAISSSACRPCRGGAPIHRPAPSSAW